MGGDDVFLALLEYRGDDRIRPGAGLFEPSGRPVPAASEFMANQLQVTRPGQYGWQRFYTEDAQPRCIYAVISPVARSPRQLVGGLVRVLATLRSGDGRRPG
jgi:hypothetical protein